MSPVTSPSTVLVTGGTGYLGAWVIATLLAHGHTVKAVVRSAEKGASLKSDLLKCINEEGGKKDSDGIAVEFIVIPDIVKDGAFDEAILGVDAVVHVASPVPNPSLTDPQETIQPAVNGTVGVLKSALRASQRDSSYKLKRIVITSSVAALWTPSPGARTFSEEDWNTEYISEVEKLGSKTDPMTVYGASKVLAERATWEFYNAHKSEVQWDISVINPPLVFGPSIQTPKSASDLPSTLKLWWDSVIEPSSKPEAMTLSIPNGWVDVRDIAEAHVRAMETEEAGGERIIASAGTFFLNGWFDLAKKAGAEFYPGRTFPRGTAETAKDELASEIYFNTAKEKRILGIKYRTMEETTRDTLRWAAERKL
ncbi:D-lactaldehyde dehydrogenase [Ephemerocybe angulata]|uniref:D-lactaldehyde dehydrogenase n=1 Tax=Ephemerocybe angulata TaxID=980116 RepID=A0A8H6LZU9_9AGAR|nr:D-lactaldehyde dehydrogenase [Tulosesus angulatus]